MMRGKNVLVAGGTGLVGTNLVRRLAKEGANVLASWCSREPRELKELFGRFDFTRFEDCLEATRGRDCVFVCAARIFGAKIAQERPTAFVLPNFQITAGLLEASSLNGVERVVLLSSSTVYQEAFHPIREDELDLNEPPYPLYFGVGWLNRYCEQLAALYQQKRDLKVGIVRPTNIFGPGDNFEDDKAHVLPALIKRALCKESPFIVWGTGNEVRNFLFVDDLVEDLLLLCAGPCKDGPVNLGGDADLTVREAAEVILKVSGHRVAPQFDASKPTAIPYRTVNCTKASALLGNRPRTPFPEGIGRTIEWYRSTLN
jgi:GDP-L-fucose synthase